MTNLAEPLIPEQPLDDFIARQQNPGGSERANYQVRGFPSAAMVYFGKAFDALTDEEYLSLVAMLIAPNSFSVKYHPDKNRERVELI